MKLRRTVSASLQSKARRYLTPQSQAFCGEHRDQGIGELSYSFIVFCAYFEIPLGSEAGEISVIHSVNFQYITTPTSVPQQGRLGARCGAKTRVYHGASHVLFYGLTALSHVWYFDGSYPQLVGFKYHEERTVERTAPVLMGLIRRR